MDPNFVLYEHATGYALFRIKEFEDIGQVLPEVESSVLDRGRFGSIVKLVAFTPFSDAAAALENCNAISEGTPHPDLITFLETYVPEEKDVKVKLGMNDSKLAAGVSEAVPYIICQHTGVVPEIIRGIRLHFPTLIKGLTASSADKAQLGLGHSYSRAKVKFNVHRVDNMIIQSISLLDQLDKDINTFSMRIREWYSYHFPELYKCVSDQYLYAQSVALIGDRKKFTEEQVPQLVELLMDEEKAAEIMEAARMSMGMDISEIDLMNIGRFANRVMALGAYRKQLQGYLRDRMASCAPSLSALIGEQVGARLISHAGSLTNLAKYPASTIQILGAEKALFRALKTRGNTPKYGLLFHSTFIGRAQAKNKGRISRYLANKCALASRIDCFSEVPVPTYGEHLKQQVEDRLKFFDSGEAPKKNYEVMHEATVEAVELQTKIVKKRRKHEKKLRKAQEEAQNLLEGSIKQEDQPIKKKRKKGIVPEEEDGVHAENGELMAPPTKKARHDSSVKSEEDGNVKVEEDEAANDQSEVMVKTKKKKKKKTRIEQEDEELQESG